MKNTLYGILLATVLVAPAVAEECSEVVTVGNFEIEFMGAVYDGFNTNFAYCVTGIDAAEFKDLSNWLLALDEACIDENNLVGCGPEPCFYQENDPNTNITGIKWDDLEVGAGETICFDFDLEGDWTDQIHQTTAAVKAGTETAEVFGICGPVCFGCASYVKVITGDELMLNARLIHNRPPTVVTRITLSIAKIDDPSNKLAEWTEGPVTFEYGTRWEYLGPIPGIESLPPGKYFLSIKSDGMSGFQEKRTKFRIN